MNEPIAHSGTWALALIMIVVASWILYRYLAPSTWREWAGAGLVQAFIIALYAEMYGFPLTIYLLVRWFGLDRTYVNANLWSTLVGLGETGMMISSDRSPCSSRCGAAGGNWPVVLPTQARLERHPQLLLDSGCSIGAPARCSRRRARTAFRRSFSHPSASSPSPRHSSARSGPPA